MNIKMTPEERIVYLYRQGKSIQDIRRITKHSFEKVDNTIKHFLRFGVAPETPKKGRPTNLTNQALTLITLLTVQNRMSSCLLISNQLKQNGIFGCSPTTVRNGRHILHFDYKPPKHRQFLAEKQKFQRVQFANSVLCSDFNFDRIIFSDESRFFIGPDNAFKWYIRGESMPKCFDETVKYDVVAMVYDTKANFCSDCVDNQEYRQILDQSEMFQVLDARYGAGNYVFMQEGAPARRCSLTTLYLKKNVLS